MRTWCCDPEAPDLRGGRDQWSARQACPAMHPRFGHLRRGNHLVISRILLASLDPQQSMHTPMGWLCMTEPLPLLQDGMNAE